MNVTLLNNVPRSATNSYVTPVARMRITQRIVCASPPSKLPSSTRQLIGVLGSNLTVEAMHRVKVKVALLVIGVGGSGEGTAG